MASEAISSSILLIGAVVGAAFLVTAILPMIFSAGDTFGTVASSAESKMKTDFQIINTYAALNSVTIWMKNVGGNRISSYDITKSSVFFGKNNAVASYNYDATPTGKEFSYTPIHQYWDIGDTIQIDIDTTSDPVIATDVLYFSFALPNGVRRTTTFSLTKYT